MMPKSTAVLFAFSILLFAFRAEAQANPHLNKGWGIAFSLGLNSPFVDDNNANEAATYLNEWGFPMPAQRTTTGYLLVPPLSVEVDYRTTKRWAFGASINYQSHTEKAVLETWPGGDYISEEKEIHHVLAGLATLKYTWLAKRQFTVSSGLGAGYTSLLVSGRSEAGSFCFDVRPVIIRAALCCGWFLQADARYSSAPTGLDKVAGYTIGVGVVYLITER
jgi:hypothetical protein